MASKIIKHGSKRSNGIQQFSFMLSAVEPHYPADDPLWPNHANPAKPAADKVVPQVEEPKIREVDLGRLEKEAYEKGFRDGQTTGKKNAEKQLEPAMKRYSDSILEIGKIKHSLYAEAEHEVVKLAIEVAKKIVHREIQADRNIIQTLVRIALSHVTEKSSVTVRLNPMDYRHIEEQSGTTSMLDGWDISLQSDNSVGQGGCLVETKCGDIDARIEEKFREVENSFFEELK